MNLSMEGMEWNGTIEWKWNGMEWNGMESEE